MRVFVETQRRDAYYRNDPSKYGLKNFLCDDALIRVDAIQTLVVD